jgi:hypothetical protein
MCVRAYVCVYVCVCVCVCVCVLHALVLDVFALMQDVHLREELRARPA